MICFNVAVVSLVERDRERVIAVNSSNEDQCVHNFVSKKKLLLSGRRRLFK